MLLQDHQQSTSSCQVLHSVVVISSTATSYDLIEIPQHDSGPPASKSAESHLMTWKVLSMHVHRETHSGDFAGPQQKSAGNPTVYGEHIVHHTTLSVSLTRRQLLVNTAHGCLGVCSATCASIWTEYWVNQKHWTASLIGGIVEQKWRLQAAA